MFNFTKNLLATFILLISTTPIAFANIEDVLSELTGYKIIAKKTIDGEFEGCDFDKIIVFDDRTALRCFSYGYQYAYMPAAVILFNGSNIKMLVGEDIYDMQRY